MQIKTATQLLELNPTDLPLQLSGVPRSGSTAAERNIYRQLVIDNPENFPGYCSELLRDLSGYVTYERKEVPVISSFDGTKLQKEVMKIKERGDTLNFMNDSLGKEASEYDLRGVRKKLSIIDGYKYNQYFLKLLNHDLFVLGAVDQNKLIDMLNNNYWLFTYRQNYIDQILSFLYAFKTGHYHYYKTFMFEPRPQMIDKDLVKRLMLLSYSNLHLIWKDRSNVTFIEKQQLMDMEDNTDKYMKTKTNKDLLPPEILIQSPVNMINKPAQMNKLIINYDECVKLARRMMKIIAKNNDNFIEVSGDEIQLNG